MEDPCHSKFKKEKSRAMKSKKPKKPSSNEGRDWSSLPKLPLSIIASQLDPIAHVFFRSTCSAWRTFSPRPKLPLIIILANHTTSQRYTSVAFFDIDFKLLIHLPKSSFEFGSFFCGSSHGYLAFLDPSSKLYLLNPITGHKIKLPKHTAQYHKDKQFKDLHYQIKLALSAAPTDPRCVFAAISQCHNQVDTCMLKSTSWKTLLSDDYDFEDIVFYNGYFYLCFYRTLYRLDLEEANGGTEMIVIVPLALPLGLNEIDESDDDQCPQRTYLVEFSGDLVMVLMYVNEEGTYYEFLKVDFEKESLEIINLGVEDLMFLGISLGIGTSAKRYKGCSNESTLTKLTKDCEEHGLFCAQNSDIKGYLKPCNGVDQWDTLGWLTPSFLV